MKKKKIIIFDFDGVIINSFDIALEVNQLARPTLTKERYQMKFNGNIYDAEYADEVVKEIDFFFEFGKRLKTLNIDEDIKTIIKNLKKDFQLFIISSTTNDIIKEYLARHGILDCFTEIFGYDIGKSKVKKFKILFEKYGISPSETVFITDTSGDIEEAKEAKINFIVGILGGYQSKESLKRAKPNSIVKNLNDFYRIVQERIV